MVTYNGKSKVHKYVSKEMLLTMVTSGSHLRGKNKKITKLNKLVQFAFNYLNMPNNVIAYPLVS